MNQVTDYPAATIRYRLNIPLTLNAISPYLSALHTSRVAALHPDISAALQPTHCPKCGSYYFSGDHEAPSMKKRKRKRAISPQPKTLHRKCHTCGFSSDIRSNSSLEVPIRDDSSKRETAPKTRETPQDPSSESVQASQPRPDHTKSSTLQDLLSRDRQREEGLKSQKKKEEGGLAAFLKRL